MEGFAMKIASYFLLLVIGFSAGVLAFAHQGFAALGGSAGSIESDRRSFSAVDRGSMAHDAYTVREMDFDGCTVREYISQSGLVFAIAWNGLRHPDLTTLLGSYDAEYREALHNTPRRPGVRHLEVRTTGVVVEKWGHIRDLQGRAYVPELLPSGVNIDEIK
jgi:hypothetical protein